MDPTYAVVEIQCRNRVWVYIDMWKEPLPEELLRDDPDIRIYVRPWASKWTKQQSDVANGLCAEEAWQVVQDERETIKKGFFAIGNTEERILPGGGHASVVPLLMHVSWDDVTGEHPELKGLEPCCRGAQNP